MKNKSIFLGVIALAFASGALSKPAKATEDKRLECGKKVGATLALCLFKSDDNRTFIDYINQWRKIIKEYYMYFNTATIEAANKALNNIEIYINQQNAQGKWVNANKVAGFLTQFAGSLPADVVKQLDQTFEQLQLKLLKRSKPLGTWQLLSPLSNRLNAKPTTSA